MAEPKGNPLSLVSDSMPAPLYARVKQHISSRIVDGSWPPHHRVPSEAELVGSLGVSRMTVHRALRELTAEGMLVRLQASARSSPNPSGGPRCMRSTILPKTSLHAGTGITRASSAWRRNAPARHRPRHWRWRWMSGCSIP